MQMFFCHVSSFHSKSYNADVEKEKVDISPSHRIACNYFVGQMLVCYSIEAAPSSCLATRFWKRKRNSFLGPVSKLALFGELWRLTAFCVGLALGL